VLLRLLAKTRSFYAMAGASLAMLDGSEVFALIRDDVCLRNKYNPTTSPPNAYIPAYNPADIEHVVVLLMDKDGRPKMATAECTTRPTATQWCTNPEHKREILRLMLKRLDELYP